MKFTIALLLCGIVYASASPRCSKDAFDECNPSGEEDNDVIVTEEQLDKKCSYVNTVTKCQVNFMDRCSNYPPSGRRDYIREEYRMFGSFCDVSNPMRKKYLDNAKCMIDAAVRAVGKCGFLDLSRLDVQYCSKLRGALKCAEQTVLADCGEDARQVYVFSLNPEFQLREAGCL